MPVMDGKGLAENIYQDPKLRKTPILLITSEPDSFQLDSVRKQENLPGALKICGMQCLGERNSLLFVEQG